jgi:signal recognition particle subunit SEC65
MTPSMSKPSADRLVEAVHMLTIEVRSMNATLAKPRPKRKTTGQVFAEYLRGLS